LVEGAFDLGLRDVRQQREGVAGAEGEILWPDSIAARTLNTSPSANAALSNNPEREYFRLISPKDTLCS
jgi:hypothetical protein